MPDLEQYRQRSTAPPSDALARYKARPTPPAEDSGPDLASVGLGAAGLGVLGLLSRKPGMVGKAGKMLGSVRQQMMLSGLAIPKSILGNVGGAAVASAERGTMAPLKQLLSRQTAKDALAAYRNMPKTVDPAYGTMLPGPTPGRIMGSIDEAAKKAFLRAGLNEQEAAREILQTPLHGPLADALDSPIARYLVPFRRTPFNQFTEGFKTLQPTNLKAHPYLTGGVAAAGAAHGAATADERYPVSIGLGTAATARYGLPYLLGAVAGRKLAGATTSGGIAGAALPVSEYGLTSSIEDPLRPYREPALLRLLNPKR